MRSQFNRQFTTLLRVRAFGEKHSDLFPPSSLSGKMFGIIAEAITALSNNAGSQAAGLALAREGTTAKAEARQALREWVVDISRTARSIGRDHPEILAKFRLPYDVSDRALISVARGFAQNAAPLVALFVEHELSATFVQELEGAIACFEDAIEDHADKRGLQVAATASIGDAMETAMDALYRLDGMVPNKIKKNPVLLREWDAARRIAAPRSSKSPDSATSPPATVTAA